MQQNTKPKLILFGSIAIFIIIVAGILAASGIFHKNPYGTSTKIDNFNRYFKEVSDNTRDATFAALHTTIADNLPEEQEVPTSGAIIRQDSITNSYNETSLATLSTFLVDIETIQQTYQIQMNWSNNPNAEIAGYSILVTCPSQNQLIYPSFTCQDMLTKDPLNNLTNQNPIINKLPITVSEYTDNYSNLIYYKISYKANEDYSKITIIIDDYSGGNRERAIQKLTEYGVKPDQYKIQYNDESYLTQTPPRSE